MRAAGEKVPSDAVEWVWRSITAQLSGNRHGLASCDWHNAAKNRQSAEIDTAAPDMVVSGQETA